MRYGYFLSLTLVLHSVVNVGAQDRQTASAPLSEPAPLGAAYRSAPTQPAIRGFVPAVSFTFGMNGPARPTTVPPQAIPTQKADSSYVPESVKQASMTEPAAPPSAPAPEKIAAPDTGKAIAIQAPCLDTMPADDYPHRSVCAAEEAACLRLPPKDQCEHAWASVDYLLWRLKNAPVPTALITTSTPASQGLLGQLDTTVVFGGGSVDQDYFNGGRAELGFWLTNDPFIGVSAGGFVLETRAALGGLTSDANGNPLIARPFTNAVTGASSTFLTASPSLFSGAASAFASTQLWGAEGNLVGGIYSGPHCRVISTIGFRYLELFDRLGIGEQYQVLPAGIAAFNGVNVFSPASFTTSDLFETENKFYGGQLGLQVDLAKNCFFVNLIGKVALGTNRQSLKVNGSSTMTANGTTAGLPGGILALSSNSGVQTEDVFAVIPEGRINIGFQFTKCLSAYVGYTVLYISDVVRPGDQVDSVINPGLVPTDPSFRTTPSPARPSFPGFNHTDFWAHGFNAGVELRY